MIPEILRTENGGTFADAKMSPDNLSRGCVREGNESVRLPFFESRSVPRYIDKFAFNIFGEINVFSGLEDKKALEEHVNEGKQRS